MPSKTSDGAEYTHYPLQKKRSYANLSMRILPKGSYKDQTHNSHPPFSLSPRRMEAFNQYKTIEL